MINSEWANLDAASVNQELLSYCLSLPLDPMWVVREIAGNEGHPLREGLNSSLEALPPKSLDLFGDSEWSAAWNRLPPGPERRREIRIEYLTKLLQDLYWIRRVEVLRETSNDTHPPFGHPALYGLEPDEDGLVPLSAFDTRKRTVRLGDFVFDVPPTTPASNSSYWFMRILYTLIGDLKIGVKLDPFKIQRAEDYRAPEFKMWVYGRALDWNRIGSIREEEHARWIPEPDSIGEILGRREIACTEASWMPRGSEVHFTCEELVKPGIVSQRGCRYLHSIYDRESQTLIHVDGALRFYSRGEMTRRLATRIGLAGSAGSRVKYFRADGSMNPETWCALASAFFVWNDDIGRYFESGGELT